MKPNKGFTLIELLAVIVILAIIALITVPVVINIINSTKKGAAEDSVYGIIEAAKLTWMTTQSGFESENSRINISCKDGGCNSIVTGTKPSQGIITLINGKIYASYLKYGDYICRYENEKSICGNDRKNDIENTIYFMYTMLSNPDPNEMIEEITILCDSGQCSMKYTFSDLYNEEDTYTIEQMFAESIELLTGNSNTSIPNSGTIKYSKNGTSMANLNFGDYTCKIENGKAICTKN